MGAKRRLITNLTELQNALSLIFDTMISDKMIIGASIIKTVKK